MNSDLIQKTADYIREKFAEESSGHDWWHIWRVWQLAKKIGIEEKADMEIVELGALLHDIADWKFNDDDEGPKQARLWLESLEAEPRIIDAVVHIVEHISFKGAGEESKLTSLEGKVVQDADRLDALGAIGIARAFAYGGFKNRLMHDPEERPEQHKSFAEYKASSSATISHFYEKLLLLRDRMNTNTGKIMAEHRHQYMEAFLEEFFVEWDGKK